MRIPKGRRPTRATLGYDVDQDTRTLQRGSSRGKLYGGPASATRSDKDTFDICEPSAILRGNSAHIYSVRLSPDASKVATGDENGQIILWDLSSGLQIKSLRATSSPIRDIQFGSEGRVYAASADKTIQIWDIETGILAGKLNAHTGEIHTLFLDGSGELISGSRDGTAIVWDVEKREAKKTYNLGLSWVNAVVYFDNERTFYAGIEDGRVLRWSPEEESAHSVGTHPSWVWSMALSNDGKLLFIGSGDNTVGIWNSTTGARVGTCQGHLDKVSKVACSSDGKFVVSGSLDQSAKVWSSKSGKCLLTLRCHTKSVEDVDISSDGSIIVTASYDGTIAVWRIENHLSSIRNIVDRFDHTAAKVLILGESGSGKTALTAALTGRPWKPTESTVGAWAHHWNLASTSDIKQEIWLWDFGGQSDQRLVNSIYMSGSHLVILVFDGQRDGMFELLDDWDRSLGWLLEQGVKKILVAARMDAARVRYSRQELLDFASERKYAGYIETSAKTGMGCDQLRRLIISSIDWRSVAWVSSPKIFQKIREIVLSLKQRGLKLTRLDELSTIINTILIQDDYTITNQEISQIIEILSASGLIWDLGFDGWILLDPSLMSQYANAIVRIIRDNYGGKGCIFEDELFDADLSIVDHNTISAVDRKHVIIALHRILIERGLAYRQPTDRGTLLILPSYYSNERPDAGGDMISSVRYEFTGYLDQIYATLVVRLSYSSAFTSAGLWRYSADFLGPEGYRAGVKVSRGQGERHSLEIKFGTGVTLDRQILLSRYVHEHLISNATDIVRKRQYVCPHCSTPVGNSLVATQLLKVGRKDIPCIRCDDSARRIILWDVVEQQFADSSVRALAVEIADQSRHRIASASKERLLVGEVQSIVARADQIFREFTVQDNGIDAEIEFRDMVGNASPFRIYLQLKSGDSHLRLRKSDGSEIFRVSKRHVSFWMDQLSPVFLVIRRSSGEIVWMDIRYYLKQHAAGPVKGPLSVVFSGSIFDVNSVLEMRRRLLE